MIQFEAGVHRARVRLVIAKALFRKVHAGQKGVFIRELPHVHLHTAPLLLRGKVIGRSFERRAGSRRAWLAPSMVTKLAPEFRGSGEWSRAHHSTRRRRYRFRRTLVLMPKRESLGRGRLSPSLVLCHRSRLPTAEQSAPAPSRRWRRLLVTPRVCRRKQLRHALAKNSKRLIEFDVLIHPGDLARCHATATNAVPVLDCRGARADKPPRMTFPEFMWSARLCGFRERTRASAPFPPERFT